MGATTFDRTNAMVARVSGYSEAATAAVRGPRPLWVVASFDLVAVLLAVGAVHAINGMIFNIPVPSEVSAGQGTIDEQLADRAVADAAAVAPTAMLARLITEARSTVATPDELIVFGEPALFEGRFGSEVNAPGTDTFSGTGGASGSSGGGGAAAPPATGALADPQPPLLAYVPLTERISETVAEVVSDAPPDQIASLAESATGAPLDLAADLRLGVSAGTGSSSMLSAGEASGIPVPAGGEAVAATGAVSATTSTSLGSTGPGVSNTTTSLGNAVSSGDSAVAGLLR